MNLVDIRDIEHSQRFFWAVCGTATVAIIGFTLVFGFKESLQSLVWKNTRWDRELMEGADEDEILEPSGHYADTYTGDITAL